MGLHKEMGEKRVKQLKNKVVKIVLILLAILVSILGCLIIIREVVAANIRAKQKIDSQNGIDVEEYVDIGGIKQAIHIRGTDLNNPVLLFLHGGPGFTEMPVSYRYQTNWEKYFTVVQWDQRMAGKTYIANKNNNTNKDDGINLRVSDTIELTKYLLHRFHKDNLVLVGHSWGSVLGINVIKENPELFSVYVGISQQVNLLESETLGYSKTLELAKNAKTISDIAVLESLTPYPGSNKDDYSEGFPGKMMILRKYQGKYGIGMPATYIENLKYFAPSPVYSLTDLSYYFTDIFKANHALYQYLYDDFDLRAMEHYFTIPTVFICGENDWTTPYSLFQNVYDSIHAPTKELHIIKNAAHRPMNDNEEDFMDIMINTVYPLSITP